jgi:hypothetical protein
MAAVNRMAGVKERGAIELIEEALHLLRGAPAGLILTYYVGTLPFLLGALFFWTDMAHSAYAAANCAAESLGVAVLYIWMAFWHAVFAQSLGRRVNGSAPVSWTPGRIWRIGYMQAVVQASKLFVLPAAFLCLLPFGWAFAFYQNATALADAAPNLRALVSQSARQASHHGRQSWLVVSILSIFGLIVFLNLAIALFAAPHLIKSLFGIESTFTRMGVNLMNSTLFAASAGLAWAAVDPLVKAVYVVRCFYGESVTTGEDLKAALAGLRSTAAIVCLVAAISPAARAQNGSREQELNRSIDRVIHRPEYTWRMPRNAAAKSDSRFVAFTEAALQALNHGIRRVGEWMEPLIEWIRDLFREKLAPPNSGDGALQRSKMLRSLLYLLIAILVIAAGILLRYFLRRRPSRKPAAAMQALPEQDPADNQLAPDKVPEDRWIALAQDCVARGDLRGAVRALYLGSLSYLARNALVGIHPSKTNREYETELRRRARGKADVARLFSQNARVFERAWYGDHAVSAEIIESFRENLQRMKACAEN